MKPSKATNVTWHAGHLTRDERWKALGLRGGTVWFTGLSGSGKSTVASALEQALVHRGVGAYRLDGDNVRHGLNADLGFSADDREENIRRIGEVARLFADAGVLALTSFISPYRRDRDRVRGLHDEWNLPFLEVWVEADLATCEGRDPKGLYAKARKGEITSFTGIDDPYEAPEAPDLVLHTGEQSVAECVEAALGLLEARGLLPSVPR